MWTFEYSNPYRLLTASSSISLIGEEAMERSSGDVAGGEVAGVYWAAPNWGGDEPSCTNGSYINE